jgi:hypothetical protein
VHLSPVEQRTKRGLPADPVADGAGRDGDPRRHREAHRGLPVLHQVGQRVGVHLGDHAGGVDAVADRERSASGPQRHRAVADAQPERRQLLVGHASTGEVAVNRERVGQQRVEHLVAPERAHVLVEPGSGIDGPGDGDTDPDE